MNQGSSTPTAFSAFPLDAVAAPPPPPPNNNGVGQLYGLDSFYDQRDDNRIHQAEMERRRGKTKWRRTSAAEWDDLLQNADEDEAEEQFVAQELLESLEMQEVEKLALVRGLAKREMFAYATLVGPSLLLHWMTSHHQERLEQAQLLVVVMKITFVVKRQNHNQNQTRTKTQPLAKRTLVGEARRRDQQERSKRGVGSQLPIQETTMLHATSSVMTQEGTRSLTRSKSSPSKKRVHFNNTGKGSKVISVNDEAPPSLKELREQFNVPNPRDAARFTLGVHGVGNQNLQFGHQWVDADAEGGSKLTQRRGKVDDDTLELSACRPQHACVLKVSDCPKFVMDVAAGMDPERQFVTWVVLLDEEDAPGAGRHQRMGHSGHRLQQVCSDAFIVQRKVSQEAALVAKARERATTSSQQSSPQIPSSSPSPLRQATSSGNRKKSPLRDLRRSMENTTDRSPHQRQSLQEGSPDPSLSSILDPLDSVERRQRLHDNLVESFERDRSSASTRHMRSTEKQPGTDRFFQEEPTNSVSGSLSPVAVAGYRNREFFKLMKSSPLWSLLEDEEESTLGDGGGLYQGEKEESVPSRNAAPPHPDLPIENEDTHLDERTRPPNGPKVVPLHKSRSPQLLDEEFVSYEQVVQRGGRFEDSSEENEDALRDDERNETRLPQTTMVAPPLVVAEQLQEPWGEGLPIMEALETPTGSSSNSAMSSRSDDGNAPHFTMADLEARCKAQQAARQQHHQPPPPLETLERMSLGRLLEQRQRAEDHRIFGSHVPAEVKEETHKTTGFQPFIHTASPQLENLHNDNIPNSTGYVSKELLHQAEDALALSVQTLGVLEQKLSSMDKSLATMETHWMVPSAATALASSRVGVGDSAVHSLLKDDIPVSKPELLRCAEAVNERLGLLEAAISRSELKIKSTATL